MWFFKCVDASIKLLSDFNEHDTYNYNYVHKGQLSIISLLNIPNQLDFGIMFLNLKNIYN